jgi:DNA-binding NarL/FixJ family response regulator
MHAPIPTPVQTPPGHRPQINVTQVLCVDDNDWVGESVARVLKRATAYAWAGWLPGPDGLLERLEAAPGAVVFLDIDMPGHDSFELVTEIARRFPAVRVIMLSGHLRLELIDRALASGAWGYVSKNDDTGAILAAIDNVVAGRIALSPAVFDEYQRRS